MFAFPWEGDLFVAVGLSEAGPTWGSRLRGWVGVPASSSCFSLSLPFAGFGGRRGWLALLPVTPPFFPHYF